MQIKAFEKKFQNEKFNLLFVTVAAVAVVLPVLFWGIPDGYDLPHHYQCALTFLDSIQAGELYPSWSSDRNLGYGGLELRLYPPVSHYLLALTKLVIGDWHLATWLNYSFWLILGCLGIYFWAREITEPANAVFAAVLFAVIPYRINETYQTFLYAELAAGSILPFCFAFLTRIVKTSSANTKSIVGANSLLSADVLGFAVSISILSLTHLPLTLIGAIALGIYFLGCIGWKSSAFLFSFAKASIAGLLGLAASSFFWMKVVQERYLMAKTSVYEELEVHYQFNFLLTPIQNYDEISYAISFVPFFYDLVLLLTLLVTVPMAIAGSRKNQSPEKRLWRGMWMTFAFSIFIATVLSRPLWDFLPLLFEVQFPWRWLNIVSIFAPVLAAGGISVCLRWYKNQQNAALTIVVFGLLLISLILSLSWAVFTGKYILPGEVESQVEKIAEEKGFKFWWTVWAREEFAHSEPEKVSADGRRIEIGEWKNTSRSFVVEPGQQTRARVAVFYHPNWQAFVNDRPVEISSDSSGASEFAVPPEKSFVTLKFVETNEVSAAQKISLAVWTLIISLTAITFAVNYKLGKIRFLFV